MNRDKKHKPSNRSRILECIYRNAPIARSEIAEETDITPATVTTTAAALLAERAILELGELPSPEENSSGRRKVPLDLNPTYRYSMGAEFTQKALVLCITDLKGTVIDSLYRPYTDELASKITEEIIQGAHTLAAHAQIGWERMVGIGIAVPGHMTPAADSLVTNRTTWSSFDPKTIKEQIPVPAAYENNARCMALGQYLFASADTPDSFAFFHVGLGMFCAHMVNGKIFRGNNYTAGEVGHTIANENGRRCECGKYGCLQTYSSETWLLKNARLAYHNSPDTILRELVASEAEITLETIITAYSMGDPIIGRYIRDCLKYLGIAASNIAITMNPGKFFLHGQLFRDPEIRSELMDYIQRQLLFVDQTYTDDIEILPYRPEDGAIGACALAIRKFFIS